MVEKQQQQNDKGQLMSDLLSGNTIICVTGGDM